MTDKTDVIKELPFEMETVRFRSKIPILGYRGCHPTDRPPAFRRKATTSFYYATGALFRFRGILNYEGKICELAYELHTFFNMIANKQKYGWYDLVMESIDTDGYVTIDSASLFLLFDPVDEDGNVISME